MTTRILLLTPDNILDGFGGLSTTLYEIVSYFEKHYTDVYFDIINPSYSGSASNYTAYSIQNYKQTSIMLNEDALLSCIENQSYYLSVFYDKLHENKYNLIHANDYSVGYAALILKRYLNLPLIFSLQLSICGTHVAKIQENTKNLLLSIELDILQKSDIVIFASQYYQSKFRMYCNNSIVIPNFINTDEWDSVIPYNFNNNKINIVYIGRIVHEKNIDALLDLEIPENMVIHIIGEKGDPTLYSKLCQRKSDNFVLWGNKYGHEKIALLKGADIQLIPSLHEPFGIVALEGLLAKNFIISTFNGGLSEILSENFSLKSGESANDINNCLLEYLKMSKEDITNKIELGYKHVKSVNIIHNIMNTYYELYTTI